MCPWCADAVLSSDQSFTRSAVSANFHLLLHFWQKWEGVQGACIASIPGLLHLQILIAYSAQKYCKQSKTWHAARTLRGYLGLEMRYEAGICTIVISVNRAFSRLNFDPKSRKTMDYSLWSSAKNATKIKSFLGHHLKVPFMLITMAQYQASHLIQMHGYNTSFFRRSRS